jgi:2-oxoglutarate ferredoxin oxidoreductase subunit alpha
MSLRRHLEGAFTSGEDPIPMSQSVSVALAGSGGSGVLTAGGLLLDAAAKAGWYGLMSRSSGPQIRGGESAAMLRLSTEPVECPPERFDFLLAIDWHNAERFVGEMPLDGSSYTVADSGSDDVPGVFHAMGARHLEVPLQALAKSIPGGRPNMVALGAVAALVGLPESAVQEAVTRALARKGEAALEASRAGVSAGYEALRDGPRVDGPEPISETEEERWSFTGNEAAGLGAVRGGIRFVAAYPITPATEILEWLAPALGRIGGVLVQAEDELASVNQLIGASYGGTPSLTATSGPGLALMMESIGLAVASETPIVIVDVMRGGPSTGIPTKSEQSDLNLAVYGLPGDAPHLVLAPTSVSDCLFTTQWAVHLAEALQTATIVLSDQALGQTRAIVPRPADVAFIARREIVDRVNGPYERYAVNRSGVSPMALPGTPGGQYTADGLEHTPTGTPSSQAEHHHEQLDKRARKITEHDYGEHWALAEGDADAELAVVTWGSSVGPVREALAALRAAGTRVRLVAPRLLAPTRPEAMAELLAGVSHVLVVEQTHGAQFLHYLKAYYDLPGEVRSLSQPGPLPISPAGVREALSDWRST